MITPAQTPTNPQKRTDGRQNALLMLQGEQFPYKSRQMQDMQWLARRSPSALANSHCSKP